MDPTLISAISVIASAIVAVAAALSQTILPPFLEARKWQRERAATALEHIQHTASELLESVSEVHGYTYGKEATRPGHMTDEPIVRVLNYVPTPEAPNDQIYITLLKRYYAWEVAVSPYCNETDQKALAEIREKLHSAAYHPGYFSDQASNTANTILQINKAAFEKLHKAHRR
jgi:hypothetical protein